MSPHLFGLATAGVLLTATAMAGMGSASADPAVPTCDGKPATIVAPTGGTYLGTPGDDVFVGSKGRITFHGGDGDDTICGIGANFDFLYGDGGDDRILGGGGWNRLYGGEGNDVLIGGNGDDRLYGGEGNDVLIGEGNGKPRSVFKNSFWGGPGDDRILAGVSAKRMLELSGRSSIHFGGDGVRVNLSKGTATGEGNDTIAVTPRLNVHGTPGADTFIGSHHRDTFYGHGGVDVVRSRAGNDSIHLAGPSGQVHAGAGDDRVETYDSKFVTTPLAPGVPRGEVYGGTGRDVIMVHFARPYNVWGGSGRDSYVGASPSGQVTVDTKRKWVSQAGGPTLRVRENEYWRMTAEDRVTVRGSRAAERFFVSAPSISAHLGAGNDTMHYSGIRGPGSAGRIDGGRGRNTTKYRGRKFTCVRSTCTKTPRGHKH